MHAVAVALNQEVLDELAPLGFDVERPRWHRGALHHMHEVGGDLVPAASFRAANESQKRISLRIVGALVLAEERGCRIHHLPSGEGGVSVLAHVLSEAWSPARDELHRPALHPAVVPRPRPQQPEVVKAVEVEDANEGQLIASMSHPVVSTRRALFGTVQRQETHGFVHGARQAKLSRLEEAPLLVCHVNSFRP